MKSAMIERRAWLALVAGLVLSPGVAHGWWNEEWAARKQLQLDTSAGGANITAAIGAVPVLVRLHTGNFRFDAAKEDGSDLRFVAADDKTPLKHHLEKYDALLGEALVWVGVPDLKPGSRTAIWLYYKNPKATAAEDAKGTYDAATALVYHFAEKGQPPRDSSAWGNHASAAGEGTDGSLLGRGLKLNGTSTVTVPAATSLAWTVGGKVTWSAWVKPAAAESTGVVFSRRDNGSTLTVGLEAGKPYVEVDSGKGPARVTGSAALSAAQWHHLAFTSGDAIALYVDGDLASSVAAPLPGMNTASTVGGVAAAAAAADAVPRRRGSPTAAAPTPGRAGFVGELDELTIASTDRPPGFIRVSAVSQGSDPGKFFVAGGDEENGGGGTNYFAILIRSVTLDGWVVIGLLAIMAVVSWMVIVGKATYLGAAEKANERFAARFRELSGDLAGLIRSENGDGALGEARALERSPLYRIYRIGADEMRKRVSRGRPLTSEAIEAIRASLDAGLVRENQKLNARMVLLTIAISGGPFLGLLGTVVGVMITFASIAAAGDVNVNAIAPGIAAALVATVAGLGVAIPALFAYNWLLTRVKSVTATLQVFVDELVTKGAEAFAERGGSASEGRPMMAAVSE